MPDFDEQVSEAEKRVAKLDELDGFKDRELSTILFALNAGLRRRNGCDFDAFVMLRDVVENKQ